MTMITAMLLMTVALVMTVATMPRIYLAFHKAGELDLSREHRLLRELLAQRNSWALRHLGLGLAALLMIWIAKSAPGMEVPEPLAAAMAIYAASSLLAAVLESVLAQRIDRMLASVPVSVREQDQE